METVRSEGEGDKADPRTVDSVMRAVEFVEGSLGRDIGLSDMAEAACYSPFHFSRVFAQATGHSPYDYLMRRRVAVAAEELLGTEESVIDIALEGGFGSPDAFARAFRRCFGMSPSEARRKGSYPRAIARARITREFAEESLTRPFCPPMAFDAAESIVDGFADPCPGDSPHVCIAQRDGDLGPLREFNGRPRIGAEKPPLAYPSSSLLLPPGKMARFALGICSNRLANLIEHAYRCWVPLAGVGLPDFDIVEWVEGSPKWLSLHIGS